MINNRPLILIAGFLTIFLFVGKAQSQSDFTFKIPVDLKSLHQDIDKISVTVSLYNVPSPFSDSNPITLDNAIANIGPSRELVTTLTVSMNHDKRKDIISYRCTLRLHNKKTNEWREPSFMESDPIWCQNSPGYSGGLWQGSIQ